VLLLVPEVCPNHLRTSGQDEYYLQKGPTNDQTSQIHFQTAQTLLTVQPVSQCDICTPCPTGARKQLQKSYNNYN